MKNPFRVDKQKLDCGCVRGTCSCDPTNLYPPMGCLICPTNQSVSSQIFADLDKIILSGYPYKRFHPRKYNMLKKKYL